MFFFLLNALSPENTTGRITAFSGYSRGDWAFALVGVACLAAVMAGIVYLSTLTGQ